MRALFILLAYALAFAAFGQQTPPPCQSATHRQFDFWIGHWQVTANDKPAGVNEIRLVHQDCVLHENWTSANGGFSGNSLNLYDAARGVWHQSWADSSGTLLQLEGGLENGSMVLQGQRPHQDGAAVYHRITWTPNPDGSVRQHWQTSRDETNWQTAFDGLYRKTE